MSTDEKMITIKISEEEAAAVKAVVSPLLTSDTNRARWYLRKQLGLPELPDQPDQVSDEG